MTTTTEAGCYNGWTNYETWAVKLWMDNEQGSHEWGRELARDAWKGAEADATFTRKERAALDLADQLKEDMEENNPLADKPSVYSDLLSTALSEVNWYEIAANMLDDEMGDPEACPGCGCRPGEGYTYGCRDCELAEQL